MSVPILRLRLAGYCGTITDGLTCGAISDTEEQKTLQDAACSMQAVPILWYRKVRARKSPPSTPKKSAIKVMKPGNQFVNGSPKNVAAFKDDTLFKLQRKNSKLNGVFDTSLFTDDNEKAKEEEEEELYYAGIEAVMTVCDSDEGPALEIKAHGLNFSIFQNNYEILDIDSKYDVISSFLLEKNKVGQDFLERTIPLSVIQHASPGGHWDWKNMINMKSGNCDCAVKVYGGKFCTLNCEN